MMDGAKDGRTKEYSCPSRLQYYIIGEYRIENWDKAHVFHESRGGNLWIAIPGKYFLGGTTLQFSCDEYHTQCYG
jgi:hypothetical protein